MNAGIGAAWMTASVAMAKATAHSQSVTWPGAKDSKHPPNCDGEGNAPAVYGTSSSFAHAFQASQLFWNCALVLFQGRACGRSG